MPCIHARVSTKISAEQETKIKERFGQAISILPGKSENWLMVGFEDEVSLYFKGKKDRPIAFVEVKLFGKAPGSAYEKLTAEITKILYEELQIDPDQIYIQYQETDYWGWNGRNF